MTGEVELFDARANLELRNAVDHMIARGFQELLDAEALAERLTGFRLEEEILATYEADVGYLRSEEGIITHDIGFLSADRFAASTAPA
ncbi:MAG: hypothetical protein IT338_12070 [Thermomicrobiales bacterium]|nr:hypothetical protein [Thermomicrobiales bacterium]